MAEKESATHEKASTTHAHHDELSRAKARIAELEDELHKKNKSSRRDDTHTHRAADSLSDASRNKIDAASRMIRGLSMASIEGVSMLAETLTAFADGVSNRNAATGSTSARRLASRLPADVVGGFADAVDRMADIGPRAAERYAESYREGERTKDKETPASDKGAS
jgi:hypothetical protein